MNFTCFLLVTLLLLLVICDYTRLVTATDNEEDDDDDEDDGIYCAYTKSMRFCKQMQYAQIVSRKVVALEPVNERTSAHVAHTWVNPLERRIIALEKGLEANQKLLNKLDEQLDRINAQLQVLRDDIDDNRDMVCSISRRLEEFSQRLGMSSKRKKPLNWLHNNTSAKSVWTAIERDLLMYILRDCDMTLPDINIGSFRELLVLLTHFSSFDDDTAVATIDSIKATDEWIQQSDDYKAGVLARLEHVRATEGMQEVEQMLEDWEHCKTADERSYEGLRMFLQGLEKRSKQIKAATVLAAND